MGNCHTQSPEQAVKNGVRIGGPGESQGGMSRQISEESHVSIATMSSGEESRFTSKSSTGRSGSKQVRNEPGITGVAESQVLDALMQLHSQNEDKENRARDEDKENEDNEDKGEDVVCLIDLDGVVSEVRNKKIIANIVTRDLPEKFHDESLSFDDKLEAITSLGYTVNQAQLSMKRTNSKLIDAVFYLDKTSLTATSYVAKGIVVDKNGKLRKKRKWKSSYQLRPII